MELLEVKRIATQGERLKFARKHVNLSQKELAEGLCSESNISKYENGGHEIPKERAFIMIDKINKQSENLGLNVYISMEWLYESMEEQAISIIKRKIESLNRAQEKDKIFKIRSLEDFLNENEKYCNDEIIMFSCKARSDYYFYIKQYQDALEIAETGYDIAVRVNDIDYRCNFLIRIARIQIARSNFLAAEKFLESIEYIDTENKYKRYCDLYKVSIFKKTGKYKEGIKLLEDRVDNLELEDLLFLSNCYKLDDKLIQAEQICKKAINKAIKEDNEEMLCVAYRNLSEIYFEENKKEAKYYIEQRLDINNPYHLDEHLSYAAELYIGTDNSKALELLFKAESIIAEKKERTIDDENVLSKIYTSIAKIHVDNEDYNKLKELLKKGELKIVAIK